MSFKNMLICGANGQLGNELYNILMNGNCAIGKIDESWKSCNVVRSDVVGDDVEHLDICDLNAVKKFVTENQIDVIVNCAAATNVDGCEADKEFAQKLNADAPKNLAIAAESAGATLVHISTDYVFSGTDPKPQTEDAPCAPNTVYGSTKLQGEKNVIQNCSKYFILRTAWLYGSRGNNFVRTMVSLGRTHDEITVVNDQHGSPTFAGDLAYEILAVLGTEHYGIYHATNNGDTTWDEFARRIMKNAGLNCNVKGCTTKEYAAPAPRPSYSILDNKHLRETVGDSMRRWEDAIDDFMAKTQL